MTSETELGYLVLADIGGQTLYVAKVELDHVNRMNESETDTSSKQVLARIYLRIQLH